LVSIDGMHALDYENCAIGGYCPNLAALGQNGVNYTRTSTSKPSDSFPGLMALVTGGTPRLVGAFYDVAYDRVLAPPLHDTGNGVFSGACTPNTPNGTTTEYEEGVEINQTLLNGGNPGAGLTDGGVNAIDPTRLPRDPYAGCTPVYPWNFIRANTIYRSSTQQAATRRGRTSMRSILQFQARPAQRSPAMWTITIPRKSIRTWLACRE
jgi:hypothetical protein